MAAGLQARNVNLVKLKTIIPSLARGVILVDINGINLHKDYNTDEKKIATLNTMGKLNCHW